MSCTKSFTFFNHALREFHIARKRIVLIRINSICRLPISLSSYIHYLIVFTYCYIFSQILTKMRHLIYIITLTLLIAVNKIETSDEPIQLVKPAGNHKDLELVEQNLKLLQYSDKPVAVVAVVGKFHSGKSFLMNQLMGKSTGFGVGPTVQPKTMGIWMWGKPLSFRSEKANQEIDLVFLDTEGFAANNVTENYDAKVFAVSTLISSHLLYNSVKIIDQSDIDYLELLARRTQLFALRSQLSKSKWTSDFDHDMLSFPPLTWVVQDFVQETYNQETPTEWLQRLMGSHSRESDNYTISLMDIFEEVDCHTLFVPAFDRDLLVDLSKAKDKDLHPEYRQERNALIKKLKDKVTPKEKSKKYVTGSDIAQLLRVLVNAANDGSLADVPSRWDTFVEKLQSTASDDCTTFYNKELDSYLNDKNKNEPVSLRMFDLQHQQIKAKAFELLEQLLHGLEDALTTARRDLGAGIEATYLTKRDLNEKKITLKCNDLKSKLELKAEEQLKKLILPQESVAIKKHADYICSQYVTNFQNQLQDLVDAETMKSLLSSLERSLSLLVTKLESSNRALMEKAIENIRELIMKSFDSGVGANNVGSVTKKPAVLNKIIEQYMVNSEEDFKVKTMQFVNETFYEASMALFKQDLQKRRESFIKKNQDAATSEIANSVIKFSEKFAERVSDKHIHLPIEESNLNSRLTHEGSTLVQEFEVKFADFKDCCDYEAQFNKLKQMIYAKGHEKQQENIKAYREIVRDVLKKAKEYIKMSEERYDSQYSFRKFVVQVATTSLSEGESSKWDERLKSKVIEDFISEDKDIVIMMEARKGLLSSIMGFLEYLLSLLGF